MFAKILEELRSLKQSIQNPETPRKSVQIKVLPGQTTKSILAEAVKSKCNREAKIALVEWVHRTVDKRTSDEVSLQIGLTNPKVTRRTPKRRDEKKANDTEATHAHEEPAATKKLKEDDKRGGSKSPLKSPIKLPAKTNN